MDGVLENNKPDNFIIFHIVCCLFFRKYISTQMKTIYILKTSSKTIFYNLQMVKKYLHGLENQISEGTKKISPKTA